jgi:pyruvate-ferredoxin/flavodoxin oxidoreductase
MQPQPPLREAERENFRFFVELPEIDRTVVRADVKGAQFFEPLFEFSGACAGCGETPYVKLLTQLFGDRAFIANATGCSSIYGGNLPTTPYATNRDGRGPAWSNSLFEDNAEFGLGARLAIDHQSEQARGLLPTLASQVGDDLVHELLHASQDGESGLAAQRDRVKLLRARLDGLAAPEALRLGQLADYLVRKNVWIVGGDGWAYDIGFGGLDHVLATGLDVNVLVLDTEVYSNTGGQQSKATPLGLMAMSYGNVYVAHVAFGAKDQHTLRAFQEAEAYPGPSLIIAFSPCIAHGYDLAQGLEQQKLAVKTGYWPLYRWDPQRVESGENPLQLDSGPPQAKLLDYMRNEARFRVVAQQNPKRFGELLRSAQHDVDRRALVYEELAKLHLMQRQAPSGAAGTTPRTAEA